jgi:hypothetical protein
MGDENNGDSDDVKWDVDIDGNDDVHGYNRHGDSNEDGGN